MIIEREGLKPIKKRKIDLNNLEKFSQERIDEITPILRETIEEYPISTFGLISFMRKHFQNSLSETLANSNFDYSSLNYNCYFLSKIMQDKLKKEGIDGYLMTYQANKYALSSGDAKVKEAHISVIYPTMKDDKVFYTIFDPGLKIDKPLSFYEKTDSGLILVNQNKIKVYYEAENETYPYYMDMTGINEYSYNKSNHRIFQRFNPKYETINIDEMLFPISHELLTGYKAISYSTDPNKRAYITLSHLEKKLEFSNCITGIEYIYTYEELEKMSYLELRKKISIVCEKLNLDSDDITSDIYFMIYYHNDFINYIMDQDLINEYSEMKNVKRLTR